MNKFDNPNFYTPTLHHSLRLGSLVGNSSYNGGVHLVAFRVIKNSKGYIEVVYNSVVYPEIFVNTLLSHLITKSDFGRSFLFREWGDFYTLIDDNFFIEESINELKNVSLHNEYCKENIFIDQSPHENLYIRLFDSLKKKCSIGTLDQMLTVISLWIHKEYDQFLIKLYPDTFSTESLKNETIPKDFHLLKHSLFVVKDLNLLLTKLRDLNYTVSRGPINQRSQLNSLSSFLSCVDEDYRNSLYKHHLYRIQNGSIPSGALLSRSKFSFRNIHMNIGKVKYYSTTTDVRLTGDSNYDNKLLKNRQELFQENYRIVSNILGKNHHVGSKEVQLEIELLVYNQEKLFSDINTLNSRIDFSAEGYNLITNKHKELCELMNYPDDLEVNSRFLSAKYIPLMKIIIQDLGLEQVVNLLLSFFLTIITKETLTTPDDVETPGIPTLSAFNNFGKEIFSKYLYVLYKKSDMYLKENKSLKEFIIVYENENGIKFLDFQEQNFYAMLGGNFIWNLLTVKLLTQVIDRDPEQKDETTYYLRIVGDVREKLIKNNFKVYHIPQKLPMVCEPKSYTYSTNLQLEKLGGYLLNGDNYVEDLIKNKVGVGKKTILKDPTMIIDLVNGLSKTPYKINVETLEYIYKYGLEKNIIIDTKDPSIQKYIEDPYKRCNSKANKKYRSILSKVLMERNILSIAETFSKVDKIYFPVRLDFRTRIYCDTEYFDYQKNDLAKGLISFANPGRITKYDEEVIKYFKAYGANMYGHGLDKKSLNTRVKWTDENSDKIFNFEYNDLIDKADSDTKVCFISFCFEYKRFIEFVNNIDRVYFYTYLPIQLDATCNGYQHLALLTKEVELLSKLNLDKSTHDDDPNDFYRFILDITRKHIQSEINRLESLAELDSKEQEYFNSLKVLKEVDLARSIIKQVTMKDSYSAGVPRLIKDVLNDSDFTKHETGVKGGSYYTYKDSEQQISRYDIMIFILSLKHVTRLIAPKISELTKYLNGIVSICSKLEMPIPWLLPNGAEIAQSYLIEETRKIAAFSFTKSRYTFKRYLPGKYDVKHQKRAIRPNFIHSLDASTIALLYKNLQDHNIDLYTVHDCFAVTANHVPILIYKLKKVYIKLYSSSSYLRDFDNYVRITIKNTVDKSFDFEDQFINIPNKNNSKFKSVTFPDINKILKLSDDINIEESLDSSSYPII
jgi:hypothetical protein